MFEHSKKVREGYIQVIKRVIIHKDEGNRKKLT